MKKRIEILNNNNPLIQHVNKYRDSFFKYQRKSTLNDFNRDFESLLARNLASLKKLKSNDYKNFEKILETNISFIQKQIEPLKRYEEKKGEFPKAFYTSYKLEKNVLKYYYAMEEKYQNLLLIKNNTIIKKDDKAIIVSYIHYKETPEIKELRFNLTKFVELLELIYADGVNFNSFRSLVSKAKAESKEYNEISLDTEKILLERGFQLGIPVKK